jgi:hypothetical protein
MGRRLDGLVDQPAAVTAPADSRQLALELAELALQLSQRLCRLPVHWAKPSDPDGGAERQAVAALVTGAASATRRSVAQMRWSLGQVAGLDAPKAGVACRLRTTGCRPSIQEAGLDAPLSNTSTASSATSVGVRPTRTPLASSASAFALAVPAEPDTIAPACPICLPAGAVNPAM